MQALIDEHPLRELVTRSPNYEVLVDRERALFGSWYEFFPRSIGAVARRRARTPPARPLRHGTLKDATKHLDYVAEMGFDVVYLPPVHPIGEVNRKGPNNTLDAGELGRRLALGDRFEATAATTRSTPSSARWPTSSPSCAGPTSSASRSRSTSRCRPRPTTRG